MTPGYKTKRYRDWLNAAASAIACQCVESVGGKYKIAIEVVRPDRRRRDLSNTLKPIEDALVSGGLIEDDCLAEHISMDWVQTGAPVTVRIQPLFSGSDGTGNPDEINRKP